MFIRNSRSLFNRSILRTGYDCCWGLRAYYVSLAKAKQLQLWVDHQLVFYLVSYVVVFARYCLHIFCYWDYKEFNFELVLKFRFRFTDGVVEIVSRHVFQEVSLVLFYEVIIYTDWNKVFSSFDIHVVLTSDGCWGAFSFYIEYFSLIVSPLYLMLVT